MKKYLSLVFIITIILGKSLAQNTTIRPNVVSNPQLTYDAILALPSPQRGDTVYDLTFDCLRVYNGNKWVCTYQTPNDPTPNIGAISKAGGTGDDRGQGIAVDGSGNVYVTGYFNGTAIFGATSITSAGDVDIFLAKYNSTGILQWVQKAGGTGPDGGQGIAVDGNGNVYVTGYFNGTATFGASSITSAGQFAGDINIFVTKYNSAGALQWVQQAGGINTNSVNDIAVDGSGNVHITGFLQGTATFGTTSITSAGFSDIFVAKYNSGGILQWVQKAGGETSFDGGEGIALDGNGNVYITGYFRDTATFGATSITSAGISDVFVAKYNSTGILQWVQKAGGTSLERGQGIAVDGGGNVYITGSFQGTANFGATSITSSGSDDIFVAKYNSGGNLQWIQKAGGAGFDSGYGIAVDGSGNVYITGYFEATAIFGATSITPSSGVSDIFVVKYNSTGNLQWVQKAGGTGFENGYSIAVDGSVNVYITGTFQGSATFGATSITSSGSNDIFVSRVQQ